MLTPNVKHWCDPFRLLKGVRPVSGLLQVRSAGIALQNSTLHSVNAPTVHIYRKIMNHILSLLYQTENHFLGFLGFGQQICRWCKRWFFVGYFDSKQRGQLTIHLQRGRNAVLFFLIREKTLSSLVFECGRIRVFWPRRLSTSADHIHVKTGWWFLIIFLTCKLYLGFIPDFLKKITRGKFN